jgi:hypothetical protein
MEYVVWVKRIAILAVLFHLYLYGFPSALSEEVKT